MLAKILGATLALAFTVLLSVVITRRERALDLRVLDFLDLNPDSYGLDVAVQTRAGRGVVYVVLARLGSRGLVRSRPEDPPGELPRRKYSITESGRALLVQELGSRLE